MKRAYSYTRFSTMEQKKGRSLERQTEAAVAYCKQHGLTLDTELSLHDEGVSAFRGKNADIGALGVFLKAVHAGSVPKGSFLLIETFDRLSRESAFDAQMTLQNIIHAGITVVTLMDGKQYNVQILRADMTALIYAILLMSRSHEESSTKSRRMGDAWGRKRQQARRGVMMTAATPAWIKVPRIKRGEGPQPNRRAQLIPHKVKIVKRIFAMFLEGMGKQLIAEDLNRRKVSTFRGGQYWYVTTVRLILTNRAVLGEFQPHRTDPNSRMFKRIPDGPPVKRFFPAIIDEKTFNKAQALMHGKAGPRARMPGKAIRSLLAGLATCPLCTGPAMRVTKGPHQAPVFVCRRAKFGAGCKYHGTPVPIVEQALLANAEAIYAATPGADTSLAGQITEAERALQMAEAQLFDLAMLLDGTPSKTVALKVQKAEADRDAAAQRLQDLQARAARGSLRLAAENSKRLRNALVWHATDPSDVAGVNAALRECFEKVVIDYPKQQLEMHWRQGASTTIPYGSL